MLSSASGLRRRHRLARVRSRSMLLLFVLAPLLENISISTFFSSQNGLPENGLLIESENGLTQKSANRSQPPVMFDLTLAQPAGSGWLHRLDTPTKALLVFW